MLAPTVLRTWAPRGQPPRLRHWDRHDRSSVISGLSVSPFASASGLYYQWHHHNLRQVEARPSSPSAAPFAGSGDRALGPAVASSQHRGPRLCRRLPRLHRESFPSYAPELNPDEGGWAFTKQRLANGSPDDRYQLALCLIEELDSCRGSQRKLRGCIPHSGLPLLRA